ncbi:hypothetical protein A2U01_0044209, partial [Trifolium medium]|nr:hypothetical protein [Trifolium medium]
AVVGTVAPLPESDRHGSQPLKTGGPVEAQPESSCS